jgi:cytosolic carboxypeptidase protein 2/3
VYFAHCYPYTYTDLQKDLRSLYDNRAVKAFCKRRSLCTSLAGNRCELLTITSYTEDPEVLKSRPAIVITAR